MPLIAVVIPFPTALARAMRDRNLCALRDRLGPLTADEAAGLRAVCVDLDAGPDHINADLLRSYASGPGIDGATWKAWLRAYGRLQALP